MSKGEAAVLSELRLLVYGLAGPFLTAPSDGLTHHRRAGWVAVAGALVFLSAPEMVAVHVVLERISLQVDDLDAFRALLR